MAVNFVNNLKLPEVCEYKVCGILAFLRNICHISHLFSQKREIVPYMSK